MSAILQMLGDKLQRGERQDVDVKSLCGEGKVMGLYFSAHWCPPCRGYTLHLAEWYKGFKAGKNGPQFEVVFISDDRDVNSFDKHCAKMPWPALPYAEREKKVRRRTIPSFTYIR